MKNIIDEIKKNIIIGDGAMGTMLQNYGLKAGEVPESWNLKHPEKLLEIHKKYIEAGAMLIETNTFGGNRIKLKAGRLEDKLQEVNRKAVEIAKEAVEDEYIFGSVGPTGKMMKPYGQLEFAEAVAAFSEQISILVDAGVDVIILETMSDLQELRAAVVAAKEYDIPVIAQMTYSENIFSLTGNTPEVTAIVLDSLKVDIIGVNCTSGFEHTIPVIKRYPKVTDKPLSVFPNAGKPVLKNGETTYPQTPRKFSENVQELLNYNVRIIGGCCGTTPEHIKIMKERLESAKSVKSKIINNKDTKKVFLASSREYIKLGKNDEFNISQEINEGEKEKKYLQNISKNCDLIFLDIDRLDYKNLLSNIKNPVIIKCSDSNKLTGFLQEYSGKVLVFNSQNNEVLVQIAEKYGAIFCREQELDKYGLEIINDYEKTIAGLKKE